MQTLKQLCSGIVLTLVLLQPSVPALAATTFHVSVDTSSLFGDTGFVDLQFNPGDGTAADAASQLNNWMGDLTLNVGEVIDGTVVGTLPGALNFANDTALNALLQPVTFGNVFDFTIQFSGAYETALAGSGTRFSLSLLNFFYNSLATVNPVGTILEFELMPSGEVVPTTFDADVSGSPSIVTLSAVPLPAAWPLLLTALGVLSVVRRRR